MAKEIKVECEVKDGDSLYLHEEIAAGNYGDGEFRLIRVLPNCSLVMRYAGKEAMVTMNDLGLAMLKAME